MMPMVEAESQAPEIELPDQHGNTIRLADLRGRWIVVYFYPKDDTPGCTTEACGFRDNQATLQAAGAVVLGISGDSTSSHARFAAKHSLPFQLLADSGNAVARAYGAFGHKTMYGRSYEGIIRSTFVIDPEGVVAGVWPKVKVAGHAAEVVRWLEARRR